MTLVAKKENQWPPGASSNDRNERLNNIKNKHNYSTTSHRWSQNEERIFAYIYTHIKPVHQGEILYRIQPTLKETHPPDERKDKINQKQKRQRRNELKTLQVCSFITLQS